MVQADMAIDRVRAFRGRFIERLQNLDRGDKAILRRNAGLSLGESRGVLGLFYQLVPANLSYDEEIYFLVATLSPLNDKGGSSGNLGDAMGRVRAISDSSALDRRMTVLLDSELETVSGRYVKPGELGFRLRQAVKFLASKDVGIDWGTLLDDLLQWSHPDRWVQKRWARSYFGTLKDDENKEVES